MKKLVLVALSASVLLATNGDSLIGLGAKSRAMGGVGIATFFGAENTLSNPALISEGRGSEINFGATYFAPDIKANGVKSSADKNVIPEVSVSQQINDNWTFGIGMFGSAGMGVDYRDSNNMALMQARTNLLLMKFAPALAYHKDNFSFGFAPVIQYGALDISYKLPPTFGGKQIGQGTSDDFGLGYELGAAYDITNDLKLGLVYKSKISMTYKHTLSAASVPFAGLFGGNFADNLEQPAEYGVGLSYNYGYFNFSADYKKNKWGSAKGYKDFGWKDQDVYAIGAKYEKDGTWYGIGYNHAKNPISNLPGTSASNQAMNLFNYLMFPATAKNHYSIGAGTKITKNLSLDFDVMYTPKTTVTTTVFNGTPSGATFKVDHTETSAAFSMRYNF